MSGVIRLQRVKIEFYEEGTVLSIFEDGSRCRAIPHDEDDYWEIASRCGYRHIEQYCQEHDFCHHFLAEEIGLGVSKVLWRMAHGIFVSPYKAAQEEALVMTFQRWLRDHERPIIGPGIDWHGLKHKALALLDGAK